MQPCRKKSGFPHVRTGCVTCKRRKVKCTEEKPHCLRCIRAGFICAGYATPRARIFYSSAELSSKVKPSRTQLVRNSNDTLGLIGTSSRQKIFKHRDLNLSALSALGLGNSDPFHVYSIPLGPQETKLLQILPGTVLPQQSPFAQVYERWTDTSASDDGQRYADLLSHEATAYGLLSRNAALEAPISNSHGAALPKSVLYYVTKTQAALRKELNTLGDSPTLRTLHNVLWTANFLATAEMVLGLPTAEVHISAMTRVMVLYVKTREANISIGNLIHLLFPDIMTAVLTFKHCYLDTKVWLPRLSQYMWSLAKASPSHRENIESTYTLHETVKNKTLRSVMLSQKALREIYNKTQEDLNEDEVRVLCDAVCIQELLHLGQLSNLAVATTNVLQRSELYSAQVQDESAKAYLSIAVQLWIRLASPTSLSNNTKFNIAPPLLLYLQSAIEKARYAPKVDLRQERLYAEAMLWALFVGAYTESQLRDIESNSSVNTLWFHKAFQEHSFDMQIHSWQQGQSIFEKFLHCDYLRPPVSEWWSKCEFSNES